MAKNRMVITPATVSDFSRESKLVYWKQVLPEKKIEYTTKRGDRATIDFTKQYLEKAINRFRKGGPTGFLLADADNRHTMDPERWRADVTDMRLSIPGEAPGLYAKLEFPDAKSAKAVLMNPKLGVSARIREESDGPRIIHVLGTLDPQVSGMTDWQSADLSEYPDDKVLDLSHEIYTEGKTMAKGNKTTKASGRTVDSYSDEEIDAMTDEEVDAFLTEFAPDFQAVDSDTDDELDNELEDDDEDEEDEEDSGLESGRLVGAGADLSNNRADIELANSVAAVANSRANEALRRAAAAEFRELRQGYLAAGVPPYLVDLAEPVLNRPDDMVIDLSATDDENINVAAIMREMLDASKGLIDLSDEKGHLGGFDKNSDEDPDAELLAAWDN